jgi:hypothetical protein
MDWKEALEVVVSRTKHEPFRRGCADDNPDKEKWRARMIEMATGGSPAPAAYPSALAMAGSAAAALGRAASAVVHGEAVLVPAEEFDRRLAICRGCEQFDPGPARCRICGCWTNQKLGLATEQCPLEPPRWGRWEPTTTTA